ncbi:hypothetical protein [Oerskovia sp. KBS0722]|uniref:hypothetical protein n=1 Tax=Oerskovia sp. KBS0722 TaxID=1179673 RepID=UPI00110EA2B7|nr:hypothetical protein [Oerskovia sp. KBS0722]QDW62953.1 hypothetical protein FFI11_010840 [Oerskovia sp. KBS0722]
MSAPSIDGTAGPAGPPGAPDMTARDTDRAAVDADLAAPSRPHSSLQWPAVVALTAALAFAGLVAAGVFDPMIEAL